MNKLCVLIALSVAISACDGTTLTAVNDASELSDTAVLGAKPSRTPINEVSGSGWSGTATYSRNDKRNAVDYKISATGVPNTQILACLASGAFSVCFVPTSDKKGKFSITGRQSYIPLGAQMRFQFKVLGTGAILAESPSVDVP